MKASVYTSLFNYSPDKFDLLGAFKNWSKYCDEIVIATFEDQRDIIEEEVAYVLEHDCLAGDNFLLKLWNRIKVVYCPDTLLDDPLFDGKLKNAALQDCSNELVIQLDADEKIGGDLEQWQYLSNILHQYPRPIAYMIPVIDLYKDYSHYKSVSSKWYLHLKEKTYRAPVNFAIRQDGTLDTNSSDSCELIDENGNLVPYFNDIRFYAPSKSGKDFNVNACHIIHEGYLDLNKRIENNKFWKKIWSARNGSEVEVATSLEKLEEENEAIPHGLPIKWWEN